MPEYIRQPTAEEAAAGITAETLGVSALPADAPPARRAHAEAMWAAAEAGEPCRCSGEGCKHSLACPECETGHLHHVDRYPGTMFDPTVWADEYECDGCYFSEQSGVIMPGLPWGESEGEGSSRRLRIYEGVRHPNFGNGGGTVG
ncbi:hypothetical protein ACWD33_26225 [Streptomyces xiamenensis]